mmetsp:Transcript_87594/g.203740  ORF Transcript_87594/g.203740 Transcript_87594/m.203740 type:complete len:428 (-) Transcript_87594:86-1369(-)
MGCSGCKALPHGIPTKPAGDVSAAPCSSGPTKSCALSTESDNSEVAHEPRSARLPVSPIRQVPGGTRHGPLGPRCGRPEASELFLQRPLVECGSSAFGSAAEATAAYLAKLVLNARWASRHPDVAHYFKVPLLLADVGREQDARAALDVVAKFVEQGGAGSASETYAEVYPHSPWLWICWAASRLGPMALADHCFNKLRAYQHRLTESGLVRATYVGAMDFEADFFATAMMAKAALLRGKLSSAEGAGDALVRALEANQLNMSARRRFNLRWRWQSGFVEETELSHCVLQGVSGQLYNMLGFPALVLLELQRAGARHGATYRAAATELLAFLKGCRGLFTSPDAHVVAAAAALADDKDTASRIASFLVSHQQGDGRFGSGDPEAHETMDASAETAFWLRQVELGLASRSQEPEEAPAQRQTSSSVKL